MASARRTLTRIDQVSQVKALAAPARQEIVDVLQTIGPATVAALGDALGRLPDSLYHHIHILQGVGLVRRVRRRNAAASGEAVYDVPGPSMTIKYDLTKVAMRRAINAVVRSMSRIAYRDFERAAKTGEVTVEGPGRNLRGARVKGRLDAAQIKQINRLYEELVDVVNTPPGDPKTARLHAVVFLMAPLERNARSGPTDRDAGKR